MRARDVVFVAVLLALAVSGEEPKQGKFERFELAVGDVPGRDGGSQLVIYKDWENGYLIYRQSAVINPSSGPVAGSGQLSITAVPMRLDWPPKLKSEEEK